MAGSLAKLGSSGFDCGRGVGGRTGGAAGGCGLTA
jgi:hypothetical protein